MAPQMTESFYEINVPTEQNITLETSTLSTTASEKKVQRAKKLFPYQLHEMLENVEKDGMQELISWNPQGTAFRVHKKKDAVETLLSKYFKQTKYKSFLRQLNLWGFTCVTRGPKRGSYSHPLFLRGKKMLCTEMKRQKYVPAKVCYSFSSSRGNNNNNNKCSLHPTETTLVVPLKVQKRRHNEQRPAQQQDAQKSNCQTTQPRNAAFNDFTSTTILASPVSSSTTKSSSTTITTSTTTNNCPNMEPLDLNTNNTMCSMPAQVSFGSLQQDNGLQPLQPKPSQQQVNIMDTDQQLVTNMDHTSTSVFNQNEMDLLCQELDKSSVPTTTTSTAPATTSLAAPSCFAPITPCASPTTVQEQLDEREWLKVLDNIFGEDTQWPPKPIISTSLQQEEMKEITNGAVNKADNDIIPNAVSVPAPVSSQPIVDPLQFL